LWAFSSSTPPRSPLTPGNHAQPNQHPQPRDTQRPHYQRRHIGDLLFISILKDDRLLSDLLTMRTGRHRNMTQRLAGSPFKLDFCFSPSSSTKTSTFAQNNPATRINHCNVTQRLALRSVPFSPLRSFPFSLPRRRNEYLTSDDQSTPDTKS
jgi:hypothetical protein